MPSDVDICNQALDLLGQSNITLITPPDAGSKEAGLCSRMYPIVRDEIQTAFPWTELIVRTTIAADVASPDWGPEFQFTLPGDMMKPLDMYVGGFRLDQRTIEGGKILSNEGGPLQIRYIKQNNDPNSWSALMVSSVATRMAFKMHPKLVGMDATSFRIIKDHMKEVWTAARHANGQSRTPINWGIPDSWVSVRVGSGQQVLERGIS